MKFRDIPQVSKYAGYRINVSWRFLENWLNDIRLSNGLDLDPLYQRGHVWTESQQVRYVEWVLRGGKSGKDLNFNSPGWQRTNDSHPVELVDGKQRLTAVLRFLRNELKAFDSFYSEFEDRLPIDADFVVYINDFKTKKEVMQWYIDMNTGGTVHAEEEIVRVKRLVESEG